MRGQQPAPQQPSEVAVVISGDPGTPPRYAVPDFIAASPDAAEAAKTITQVLWDDLAFEREFYLIPRDTYSTIPPARSPDQVPFAAWRELGADAVFFGTVSRMGNDIRVEVRLFNIRTQQSVFSKEYTGTVANPRLYAHTIADEIHQQQRALRGVARTKLAFSSDRNRERMVGTVENRDVKEVYMADYDGANAAPDHHQPAVEHHAGVVAGRACDRLYLVPSRLPGYLRRAHLPGAAAGADQGRRPEHAADVFARWHPHRLHVEPRRQPGNLRDERGRLERAPDHESSGD